MTEASAVVPALYGLVLAGGKSKRMGRDKGAIIWQKKEQRYHMADLLGELCQQVYISCRTEQQIEINSAYQTLPDSFCDMGPLGAIVSAFKAQSNVAWLVMACDLPLLDKVSLKALVEKRATSAMATSFRSPFDNLPEPLITIWEPKAYPLLLSSLARGYRSPKKILMKSDVRMLDAEHPKALMNVNTPEEAQAVKKILQSKEWSG